jgi:hypothetical protein
MRPNTNSLNSFSNKLRVEISDAEVVEGGVLGGLFQGFDGNPFAGGGGDKLADFKLTCRCPAS